MQDRRRKETCRRKTSNSPGRYEHPGRGATRGAGGGGLELGPKHSDHHTSLLLLAGWRMERCSESFDMNMSSAASRAHRSSAPLETCQFNRGTRTSETRIPHPCPSLSRPSTTTIFGYLRDARLLEDDCSAMTAQEHELYSGLVH